MKLLKNNLIVSSGSLIIENNLFQSLAHLENIVTHLNYRGLGLSKIVVSWLTNIAKTCYCEKIDLFCKPEMADFYVKIGLNK